MYRQTVLTLCSKYVFSPALRCLPARPGFLVLNYHRIGDQLSCNLDRGVFSATAEDFRAQLLFLKEHFHVTTLEEMLWLIRNPHSIRRVEVLITFDDGYRDNYEIAFPILREHGLQATFFLVTSYVGSNLLPWWDTIASILRTTNVPVVELTYPHTTSIRLGAEIDSAIARVLRIYKSSATQDPERFIRELKLACENTRSVVDETVFLTWQQARQMSDAGMAIGSHTHFHRVLSKLSYEEQAEELATSRDVLSGRLHVTPRALAFPVGKRDAFNRATLQAAEATGYHAAFSYYGGFNACNRVQYFNVLREGVDADVTLEEFQLRTTMLPRLGSTN